MKHGVWMANNTRVHPQCSVHICTDGIITHYCNSEKICWPIFQTNIETCPCICVRCSLRSARSVMCVCARVRARVWMCVCVPVCVVGGLTGSWLWLPQATTLMCVKWGSSQRWALGNEMWAVCVSVCHVHITHMSNSLTPLQMWVTLRLQALSVDSPLRILSDMEQSSVGSVG